MGVVFDFRGCGAEIAKNSVDFGYDNVPLVLGDCRKLANIIIATVAVPYVRRLRKMIIVEGLVALPQATRTM